MSSEIYNRLRMWAAYAEGGRHPGVPAVTNAEAAAHIERLEEALRTCADISSQPEVVRTARAALGTDNGEEGW